MDPIRLALDRPVTIAVCVLLAVMAGLIALREIPIQLTPTVDRPIVNVTTLWPGRSPDEIVEEITKEQEKRLKNVSNLKKMTSISREGQSAITLEFYLGTDLTRALQEVSDALRQVPSYPEEVDEPVIRSSEGAAESAIAWIIIDLDPAQAHKHPGFDITTMYDAFDREVKPFMERIDGVAEVNIYGGRERQVQVLTDPVALAQRGLSHLDVVESIRAENTIISAGTIPEGKRDFRVRLSGQYREPEEVLDTVVAYRDGRPVRVRDVAEVRLGHERPRGFVRSMGVPCLAMNVIRQSGSNVMEIMPQVRDRLDEVRAEILPRLHPTAGNDLRIRQVYDETVYIDSAIDLVLSNLRYGGALAVICLLLFLRSLRATLVVAITIPVSIIGTFLVMALAGRTLNVVSLAGLAFSTGMVVDNAVVVLENIQRRIGLGDSPLRAAYHGTREVWSAVLAGTLTTVAVFVPILTVREEVGQLFFDLSLALAVSVALSLLVSITVIPAAEGVFARMRNDQPPRHYKWTQSLFGVVPLIARAGAAYSRAIRWCMDSWRGWLLRPAIVLVVVGASIAGSRALMPPLDYLPAGNQNLVFGGMLIPPGQSIEQLNAYADGIDRGVGPYLLRPGLTPEEIAKLPPIRSFTGVTHAPVGVANYFVGAFEGGMFAGAISADPDRVIPVGALLTNAMNGMPDAFGGAAQTSIFGGGIRGGDEILLEVSGPDQAAVQRAAGMMYGIAGSKYGFGVSVQPIPANFDSLQPEWVLRLTQAGRELGLRTRDLGVPLRALVDGAYAGEFRLADRNVDLILLPAAGRLDYKELLKDVPVVVPAGQVVPMSVVASVEPGRAPQEIRRAEELPSVAIRVRPPQGRAIEELMEEIRAEVVAPARASGLIDATMRVRLEGTAAKLDDVRASLFGVANPGGSGSAWSWRITLALGLAGVIASVLVLIRARRRKAAGAGYAVAGLLVLAAILAGLTALLLNQPQLLAARFAWALLVTYFLMCALFESFISPLVIMFSVPPAVVGGFAALRLVHESTLANPNLAPQQLDTLTMIGFVILIGTVVNNAILIVEQAINFAHPERTGSTDAPLSPHDAIAESVRTRLRPIFMTALTTICGGLPLVLAPGAGSEMYRGLGAVILGGLALSTVITLVVVPLAYSLTVDMRDAVVRAWFAGAKKPVVAQAGASPTPADRA